MGGRRHYPAEWGWGMPGAGAPTRALPPMLVGDATHSNLGRSINPPHLTSSVAVTDWLSVALQRVRAGERWLDRHYPAWRARADARAFDVRSTTDNPLSAATGRYVFSALTRHRLTPIDVVRLGFSAGNGVDATEMNLAWILCAQGWEVIPSPDSTASAASS